MSQKRFVGISSSGFEDVVRVNYKSCQTMFCHDAARLALPQVNRIVLQDVEERIILSRCDGQLQDIADKKRHYGTATASLAFQMAYIRNGRVIFEVQSSIPVRVAIKDGRTKATRSILSSITIDLFRSAQELLPVAEEISVMVQIV